VIVAILLNHALEGLGVIFLLRGVYHVTKGNGISRAFF
jgi:hypothetical protein